MKQKLPRNVKIQIFVTQEDHAILSEIAELTNESLSFTVADLIQALMPGLKKQLFILRKVYGLKSQEKKVISEQLAETEKKLQRDIDKSFADIDNVLK